MCGIAGFYGQGNKEDLVRMLKVLEKRGPDMDGTFIQPPFFSGHKRLSIIDLSLNARQPMSNEDGSIRVGCNGEIYNFRQIKDGLLEKGHKFLSNSDTEVIAHLYEEQGFEAFKQLVGMFALFIWDGRKRKVILVRDRMGQKPLFYARQNGNFFFASEARAIVRHAYFRTQLDLSAMAKYLLHEHVPTPDAIWQNMHKLLPGTFLVFNTISGVISLEKYWKLKFSPKIYLSEEEYIQEIDRRLRKSVKRRMIADVPIGIFMSGGLDSTAVAYYAQQESSSPIKTFSIGFRERSYSELPQAKIIADYFKTDHQEIVMLSKDALALVSEVAEQLDEPFADSSIVPYYYLSKIARNKITVALGGDGGDELFVGYPQIKANRLLKWYRFIPASIRKGILIPLIKAIPTSFRKLTWDYKMKKFIEVEDFINNPLLCQKIWMGAFVPQYLAQLLDPDIFKKIKPSLFEDVENLCRGLDSRETLNDQILHITQHQYLMDDGLVKVDRSSMMNSLEVRSPFLDHELVEFVNRIPFEIKFYHGRYKYLYKKLLKKRFPPQVMNLPKRGFALPISEWFICDFRETIEKNIFQGNDGLFNTNFVRKIWNEHLRKSFNFRKPLWTFFIWKLWSKHNL